jgi:hypothetical protein
MVAISSFETSDFLRITNPYNPEHRNFQNLTRPLYWLLNLIPGMSIEMESFIDVE